MAAIDKTETCVLIPAYNEEKNIGPVLEKLKKRGVAIVVSDDGSKDHTAEVSRSLGALVLTAGGNEGKGSSLRRGFQWFLQQNYGALVLMDADGQHDPAELDLFLGALNQPGAHFVIGTRMHNPQGMPPVRVATNRLMSWMLSWMAGQKVPDSQCGYRALKREVVEKMALHSSRFEIESEMILEASRLGFGVRSIPITSVYIGDSSHIQPLRDTLRFLKFLLKYLFKPKISK